MSPTSKGYYESPREAECLARALRIEPAGANAEVILDRTIFYPEGGGQPCDLGTIGGARVLNVVERGEEIVHEVEGTPAFAAGDEVGLRLDWTRRRDHCQQHSGQHLLSAILEREYGIHTVGFHLGAVYSTIDVSCPALDGAMAERAESIAESFIAEGRPYRTHLCPPEDPASFPFRKKLPSGASVIRIVEIDGYDWVACCGTHVASADELRVLKILGAEKYKGNTRIYFAAGDRAVSVLRARFSLLAAVAGSLGTSAEEAPGKVSGLLERARELAAGRDALVRDRAGLEVELALARSAENCRLLRFSYADRGADEAFETAKAGAARGFAVVAASVPDRTVCVMKPSDMDGSAARSLPLGAALKPLLEDFRGKGGGGFNNFRAVFESAEGAAAFSGKAAALLSGE